ncbi:MAG: glutamine-hydrolyzing carbamoyl-phosphate synthase small subunit, partial [Bacteroidaceae bacterium]|nr:glutamine-hydrolyzing carbamoyl-phosphate synthase small subunit [Bacteroidaceae bacterium]
MTLRQAQVKKREARLILDDGTVFCGWSFGAEVNTVGEVVFNTAMMGYPESLTDPSYAGQILVTTFPLIGNYGVPETDGEPLPTFMESDKIHVKGLIVADYSQEYSHWNAKESLSSWLKREGIPAISGIDTRRLTKLLREHGVMRGRISLAPASSPKGEGSDNLDEDYGSINWVEKVSCKEVITYKPDNSQFSILNSQLKKVVLVDCGVKANIIRCLLNRGVEVIRVPWDYDFNQLEFAGLFLANGPGDPEQCTKTIEHIRTFLCNKEVKPLMGICLGNQLLARAAGAKTYKLKYGHRSHNQPVRRVGSTQCFITSQNHGYAVDAATLPEDWEPLFVNMNDGSNEGIRHKTNPWFSAQFHPEACSGPTDTEWMFDTFIDNLEHGELNSRPWSVEQSTVVNRAIDRGQLNNRPWSIEQSTVVNQKTVRKVLLLGSGALKIGQAGEFDYSGAQALKALKEEGVESVLINPNIATVQTSEGVADKVYFQPVTPEFVERVIAQERPDGILLSFGGQTALNCGVELYQKGVLEKYGVRVLGTPVQAIIDTEDRDLFVKKLDE